MEMTKRFDTNYHYTVPELDSDTTFSTSSHKVVIEYKEEKVKTSKGKQKIEIKKIEALEARQVTFSKRKFGIFSKATELSTMCGAKVAVLVESPAGHPFSFGSPSVEHVANLFLKGGSGNTENDAQEAQRLSGVQQLNSSLMETGSKIESAKLKKAVLMSRIADLSAKNEDVRRMENLENLNLVELEKTIEILERFKENIKTVMLKDMVADSGNPSSTLQNQSGNGIGAAPSSVSAAAMTVFLEPGLKVDNAGSSHGAVSAAAMTVFSEPGLRVDDAGSSYGTGKVIDIDMNLSIYEDESFDNVEQTNPFFDVNANDAGPSEPCHFPDDNKGNFTPNGDPK